MDSCVRTQGDDQRWDLILALNIARNKVAHNFDGPQRAEALQKLRNELAGSFNDAAAHVAGLDDYKTVLISSMDSIAFLVHPKTELSS